MELLMLQVEILWPAMIAGLIILFTHVPLGREVLQRGIIFLDLAIAQIAAFGVVAANTLWISEGSAVPQTLIAVSAAIVGALSLYKIRRLEVRVQEAIIGILFILAATGSILLLSTDPHGGEQLKKILVGQILWLQPQELIPLASAYVIIICVWCSLKKNVGEWLFYPLFAVTITLSTQVVGVYLVFASLIIPSLVTLRHSRPKLKAFIIGALGYGFGLVFAAIFDLPAGAAIVWSLALVAANYYVADCVLTKARRRFKIEPIKTL
jgi:zinc/manganese transport system permease protein